MFWLAVHTFSVNGQCSGMNPWFWFLVKTGGVRPTPTRNTTRFSPAKSHRIIIIISLLCSWPVPPIVNNFITTRSPPPPYSFPSLGKFCCITPVLNRLKRMTSTSASQCCSVCCQQALKCQLKCLINQKWRSDQQWRRQVYGAFFLHFFFYFIVVFYFVLSAAGTTVWLLRLPFRGDNKALSDKRSTVIWVSFDFDLQPSSISVI